MQFIRRHKWLIMGGGLAAVLAGFLLFRPDKLFVDDTVDESLSDAFASPQAAAPSEPLATTPESNTDVDSQGGIDSESTTTTIPATTTTVQAGPTTVTVGDFFGIDHEAAGTAAIYEFEGDRVLRFEDDTDIQNGPDLHVWLLASDDYDETSIPGDYLYLGNLKGNVGGQNYELPPEFDPEIHRYVLIWCERFDVPFAAAPLA